MNAEGEECQVGIVSITVRKRGSEGNVFLGAQTRNTRQSGGGRGKGGDEKLLK
jgi:hypothetical protein